MLIALAIPVRTRPCSIVASWLRALMQCLHGCRPIFLALRSKNPSQCVLFDVSRVMFEKMEDIPLLTPNIESRLGWTLLCLEDKPWLHS